MKNTDFMNEYKRWLEADGLSADIKAELEEIKNNETAIAERFATPLEFGTGGMRGILGAGIGRMNIYTVGRASAGFAAYIASSSPTAAERGVVISHDNRRYSREFALVTAGVFAAAGVRAYLFDSLRPTPMLSFAVRRMGAAGGVMITASHNPPEYNGYKIYNSDGCQLDVAQSDIVISNIAAIENPLTVPCLTLEEAGDLIRFLPPELDDEYCMRVCAISIARDREAAKDIRVVYSPQHGTGNVPVRRVLSESGYDVVPVLSQCEPDGDFSGTKNPNPESPDAYIDALKIADEVNADIVITTDPDCDRLGVAARRKNGEMQLITGNQTAAILLEYILSRRTADGSLPENPFAVTTLVTSDIGDYICSAYGVKLEKTLTGFKYIGERIALHNAKKDASFVFGYEESYGCLISEFVRDKDGVQASLMLCEAAAYYKKLGMSLVDALEAVYAKYGFFLDTQSNFYFKGLDGSSKIAALTGGLRKNAPTEVGGLAVLRVEDYLSEQTQAMGYPASDMLRFIFENGWVAVRPSGTEPKCKFYYSIRANSEKEAKERLAVLKAAFEPQNA